MRRRRKTGEMAAAFTLVELLVVIAVISILATLLLPSLNRAKEASYSTVCRSNLRQWGIGMRMYLDEEKGYPTDWINQPGTRFDARHWYKRLEPFTRARWPQSDPPDARYDTDRAVTLCPAFKRLPNRYFGEFSGSYGYNGSGIVQWGLISGNTDAKGLESIIPPDPTVKEDQVVNPSAMIAIGDSLIAIDSTSTRTLGDINFSPIDSLGSPSMWAELDIGGYSTVTGAASWGRLTRRRHGRRFNVLFCDGHVEHLKPQNLFEVRKDEVLKLWNRDNLPHRELVGWDQ